LTATSIATGMHDARGRRELPLLLTLATMQLTHILDFMIMMPLGPQFMRLFGLDPRQFALLVSAYTFAAAASGFVAGFWVDRFGRKRALLAMYGGFIVATALCGLAPGYAWLLAGRVVAGVFGGVMGALVMTIVADVVPYVRRARATALISAAFSLASVAGVPLGLWLASMFSWRAPFLALALFSLIVALIAHRLLPALDGNLATFERRGPIEQLRAIVAVPNHRWAFAFMVALMMSVFTIVPFFAPYNVANVGLTEAQLPIIYFCGGLTTLFTAQVIGWLADRYGKKRVFTVIAFISIVPILVFTNLPPLPLPYVVVVVVVFFIFVPGRFGPAMALVTGGAEPRLRGSFMSFNAAIQQLGSGFAALVGGLIVGRAADGTLTHYHWAGWLAVVCTLLAVALAHRIKVVQDKPVPHG
jgi:predicted MFS family arabinose efflux permease